jgi:hypothetical protein
MTHPSFRQKCKTMVFSLFTLLSKVFRRIGFFNQGFKGVRFFEQITRKFYNSRDMYKRLHDGNLPPPEDHVSVIPDAIPIEDPIEVDDPLDTYIAETRTSARRAGEERRSYIF